MATTNPMQSKSMPAQPEFITPAEDMLKKCIFFDTKILNNFEDLSDKKFTLTVENIKQKFNILNVYELNSSSVNNALILEWVKRSDNYTTNFYETNYGFEAINDNNQCYAFEFQSWVEMVKIKYNNNNEGKYIDLRNHEYKYLIIDFHHDDREYGINNNPDFIIYFVKNLQEVINSYDWQIELSVPWKGITKSLINHIQEINWISRQTYFYQNTINSLTSLTLPSNIAKNLQSSLYCYNNKTPEIIIKRYCKVEYIESTSGKPIQLKYLPNGSRIDNMTNTTRVDNIVTEMKCTFTKFGGDIFYGTIITDNSDYRFFIGGEIDNDNERKLYWDIGSQRLSGGILNNIKTDINIIYDLKLARHKIESFNIETNSWETWISHNNPGTFTWTVNQDEEVRLKLFSNSDYGRIFKFKLYNATNKNLIANLIPVYDLVSKQYGLIDINDNYYFYTNDDLTGAIPNTFQHTDNTLNNILTKPTLLKENIYAWGECQKENTVNAGYRVFNKYDFFIDDNSITLPIYDLESICSFKYLHEIVSTNEDSYLKNKDLYLEIDFSTTVRYRLKNEGPWTLLYDKNGKNVNGIWVALQASGGWGNFGVRLKTICWNGSSGGSGSFGVLYFNMKRCAYKSIKIATEKISSKLDDTSIYSYNIVVSEISDSSSEKELYKFQCGGNGTAEFSTESLGKGGKGGKILHSNIYNNFIQPIILLEGLNGSDSVDSDKGSVSSLRSTGYENISKNMPILKQLFYLNHNGYGVSYTIEDTKGQWVENTGVAKSPGAISICSKSNGLTGSGNNMDKDSKMEGYGYGGWGGNIWRSSKVFSNSSDSDTPLETESVWPYGTPGKPAIWILETE